MKTRLPKRTTLTENCIHASRRDQTCKFRRKSPKSLLNDTLGDQALYRFVLPNAIDFSIVVTLEVASKFGSTFDFAKRLAIKIARVVRRRIRRLSTSNLVPWIFTRTVKRQFRDSHIANRFCHLLMNPLNRQSEVFKTATFKHRSERTKANDV